MTKLTPAEHLALGTYLSSYDEDLDFETNLNHFINEDHDDIYACEFYENYNTELIAHFIRDLAINIESIISVK